MFRRFFASAREWFLFIDAIGHLALIVALSLYILHLLQPLAPLITFLICLSLTISALDGKRLERSMVIGGIALYASGWAAAPFIGPIGGSLLCVTGFLVWAQGVMWVLAPSAAPRRLPPA